MHQKKFCKPFNDKKSFAYIICEEYLVQPFDITFISLNDFCFKKYFLKEVLSNLMEKLKQKYVLLKF